VVVDGWRESKDAVGIDGWSVKLRFIGRFDGGLD
jgi:hypothetical protein